MNIIESFITGISEILSHKFQSLLTMLGVIFGVSAVIGMVSIGEGAQKEAMEQLKKLGSNTIIVKRVEPVGYANLMAELKKSPYGLNNSQMKGLVNTVTAISEYSPTREASNVARGINRDAKKITLIGTTPNFISTTSMKIAEGRFINEIDDKYIDNVCVLGADAAKELFLFESAVGKNVRIGEKESFRCVGVLEAQESSTLVKTTDYNKAVYIPFSTSVKKFTLSSTTEAAANTSSEQGVPRKVRQAMYTLQRLTVPIKNAPLSSIILKISDANNYREVASAIDNYFLQRNSGLKNYEMIVPLELIKQQQQTQQIFNIVMGAIASISLLVGGIGIMNIMLATVTQRTREIGIRRCLGATKFNILFQFIIESLIITMMGGAIGVGLGILLAGVISQYAKWQTVISYTAIIYAIGVSTLVGVVFGLYPAWKAASTDPIRALKYE